MDPVEHVTKHYNALFVLPHDPAARPGWSAALSVLVPGLGQALLGQHMRGVQLFLGSAVLLFGCGLCNLLVAADAWSIASQLREGPVKVSHASRWIAWPMAPFALIQDLFVG